MEKKRLFKIMFKSDREIIRELADEIKSNKEIMIVKEPSKSLAMIKMREPVKESLFYMGEVIICEAIVEIEGTKGIAVSMGDDFEKILNMAIIDAACNKGIFYRYDYLTELEKEHINKEEKENAMIMKTMVNFKSMDSEVN